MSSLAAALPVFYQSSIGKKILVALTGGFLVVFVLGHMIGNLLLFKGPEAINEYGHMLQSAGHGMLVWVARFFIFGAIGVRVIPTRHLGWDKSRCNGVHSNTTLANFNRHGFGQLHERGFRHCIDGNIR